MGVLSTRPYSSFKPQFEKICTKKECFFIDTLSEVKSDNSIYINPENLTALSIALSQAQQSMGDKVTIVFDSINNLSIRNESSVLYKFFMFILNKAHDWQADIVLIAAEGGKDSSSLIDLIKQRADKVEKR